MDALALLCNLYGDGPSTLARLRARGIRRIEDLSGKTPAEVGACLSVSIASAKRFLGEAAALEKRVVVAEPAGAAPAPAAPRKGKVPARVRELSPEPPAVRPRSQSKRALLAAATKRWGELDAREAASATTATAGARTGSRPEAEPAAVAPAAPRTSTPLASLDVDRATVEALARGGVTTQEELVLMTAEDLSAASGLGLSQVLFVQGLARRRLRASESEAARPGQGLAPAELVAPVASSAPVASCAPGAPQLAPASISFTSPSAGSSPSSFLDSSLGSSSAGEALRECVIAPGSTAQVRFSPSERPPREWLAEPDSGDDRSVAGNAGESAGPFA